MALNVNHAGTSQSVRRVESLVQAHLSFSLLMVIIIDNIYKARVDVGTSSSVCVSQYACARVSMCVCARMARARACCVTFCSRAECGRVPTA